MNERSVKLTPRQVIALVWAIGGAQDGSTPAELNLPPVIADRVSDVLDAMRPDVAGRVNVPLPSLAASYAVSDLGYRLSVQLPSMAEGMADTDAAERAAAATVRDGCGAWRRLRTRYETVGGIVDAGVVTGSGNRDLVYKD